MQKKIFAYIWSNIAVPGYQGQPKETTVIKQSLCGKTECITLTMYKSPQAAHGRWLMVSIKQFLGIWAI
jgi:hypothetical protein